MKTLIILALTFTVNASIIEGCFKTISFDFKKVEHGPILWKNQTVFEENNNSYTYKTEEGKYLNLELLTLFTGFDQKLTSYSYSPIVMFKGHGTKIDNSFTYYYEVDTEFLMKDGSAYSPVDHFVNLNIIKIGKRLYGTFIYNSKARNHSRFHDFVLESEECKF